MTESLRELLERDPFQPFSIVTAGGDKYRIPNPRLVAMGKDILCIFPPRSNHFIFVRNNQITALESLNHAA